MSKVQDTRSRCGTHVFITYNQILPSEAQKRLRQKATEDAGHENAKAKQTRKMDGGEAEEQ